MVAIMASVKLSDRLINDAKITAQALHRSVPMQIEHWAMIGKICEENPDLPVNFIEGILIGMAEIEAGEVTEYVFRSC
jgi:hypothetical protein